MMNLDVIRTGGKIAMGGVTVAVVVFLVVVFIFVLFCARSLGGRIGSRSNSSKDTIDRSEVIGRFPRRTIGTRDISMVRKMSDKQA